MQEEQEPIKCEHEWVSFNYDAKKQKQITRCKLCHKTIEVEVFYKAYFNSSAVLHERVVWLEEQMGLVKEQLNNLNTYIK